MQLRVYHAVALVAAFLLFAANAGAQQVTGTVTDEQSGQPLAGVQVFIVGSGVGALTQQDGRYLLQDVPVGTHALRVVQIGYATATQEVTVAADATAVQDFALSLEALGLDEIVVTGTPGGTQRRAIGNTVASVQAGDITEQVEFNDVEGLLGQRVPGLQLSRATGIVGAGSDIEIRGISTFALGRQPLIYVDGIRVNNQSDAGPRTGSERQVNVLNDFNPEDIASIEIIKGPAAATLYGTEASAGVIQIITKDGQVGAPEFNISVSQGVNFVRNPEGRIGTKWTCENSFDPPCREGEGLIPYNAIAEADRLLDSGEYPFWSHDIWPQENLFQYGHSQSYNLGVRGGTETIRYFLQGNLDRDEGQVYFNWNEAARMRANLNVVFSENLSLDVSTGYVSGRTSLGSPAPDEGGIWDDLGWGNGYCIPTVSADEDPCPRLLGFNEHLPTDIARVSATRDYQRFTGSGTLNFTLGDWLSSRATFGIDRGWDENGLLFPVETQQTSVYFRAYGQTSEGAVHIERPITTVKTLDWSATADLSVGDGWSSASSVGVQYYISTDESLVNRGEGFASPLSRTINQTPVTRAEIEYSFIENKSLGVYFQERIGWNNRLFVTGAVRLDDNSAFGSELSPEVYPKVSGTWVISEEGFWNFDLVNSLRLRGAWGKAGRQPQTFANTDTYGVMPGPGGTTALDPTNTGNVNVGPEVGSELELGFDYALLDDRVDGQFTWYSQKTTDALLGVPLPPSMGAGGDMQRNIGRIDNWGWEATLNSRIYESPDFSFSLLLTGSHTDNEVKSLGEFPGSNDIRIGWPYPVRTESEYWVMEAEYDPEGPITDAWGQRIRAYCDSGVVLGGGDDPRGKYGVVRGGELVPCEEVGDYPISAGPAFFTHRYSVIPTIALFNNALQIHALFDGAYGKTGLDGTQEWGHRYNNSYDSRCECDPRWVAGDRLGSVVTWGYFDADFWKLREVGLRYNIPDEMAGWFGADGASLTFSAREVAILWQAQDYIGLEPGADTGNPQLNVLDPEIGRATSGNVAEHRLNPPNTSLNITLDFTF